MKIIITGPKNSGKSTIGVQLAEIFSLKFYDTDTVIEEIYAEKNNENLTFRQIYQKEGEKAFREWEKLAIEKISSLEYCIVSTGGGTVFSSELRKLLFKDSIVIYLNGEEEILWQRMQTSGVPDFYKGENGRELHKSRVEKLTETINHLADIVIEIENKTPEELTKLIAGQLTSYITIRMQSPNTFGEIIRVTTFGESHGKALGAVLDGVPPGIEITADDIQHELNRRRPGQSKVTTPRNEADKVEILSGIFDGKTTGCPICLVVFNKDQDSSKYDNLKEIFRPGHADFTFWKKYGTRDHRGGGRTSGRETIGRVAAGAIAKKILNKQGINITAFAQEIAGVKGEQEDFSQIEKNIVRAADKEAAVLMENAIVDAGNRKDSVGGIVKLVIDNLSAGLGDPVFYKLDARLAAAMFSLGAVKGFEIGAGFEAAKMQGSENNDKMNESGFLSNNAGGILGGISNGESIVARIAVKPTPSIFQQQQTVNLLGELTNISIAGRHDPCIVPRIIPVVESMAALVLLDAIYTNDKIKKYKLS